jgi:hypothetical protein
MITVEEAVKSLYSHVTLEPYRTAASWVNTQTFTVDPTLQLTNTPFLLDTQLHTIKEDTQ